MQRLESGASRAGIHAGFAGRVALLLVLSISGVSHAEEVEWRIATVFPDDTKPHKALVKSAKTLARATRGQFKLRYVGTAFDSETSVLDRLQEEDALAAALVSNFEYGRLVPNANLYSQLFVFESRDEIGAIRAQLDTELLSRIQHDDFVVLGISGVGSAYLMAREPVRGMDDLVGNTVWMPDGFACDAARLCTSPLKFQAATTQWSESVPEEQLPPLMMHSPIALILDKRIPRYPYVLHPAIQYGYLLVVVKRHKWESLSLDDRRSLQSYFDSELADLESKARQAEVRAAKILRKRGMVRIDLPTTDVRRLRIAGYRSDIAAPLQSLLSNALAASRRKIGGQ